MSRAIVDILTCLWDSARADFLDLNPVRDDSYLTIAGAEELINAEIAAKVKTARIKALEKALKAIESMSGRL